MKLLKSIQEYSTVVFTLLGILFGGILMTFVFGLLGPGDLIQDSTSIHTNLSNVYINSTGYTIPEATQSGFVGGVAVISAYNSTSGLEILSGNYSIDSATGTIYNATSTTWESVNLTYSYLHKAEAKLISETIQNDSLNAIQAYSSQSSTQFTTVGLAITLLILIGLFLVFWRSFVKKEGKGKGGSSGGNFM